MSAPNALAPTFTVFDETHLFTAEAVSKMKALTAKLKPVPLTTTTTMPKPVHVKVTAHELLRMGRVAKPGPLRMQPAGLAAAQKGTEPGALWELPDGIDIWESQVTE